MEWIVTTGRSIEEAKEAALDQLGVAEDEAEFEIEEEPKPGLFGRLRREARVRARVLPVQPRPKVERRRSDRGRRKGGESRATAGSTTTDPIGDDREPASTGSRSSGERRSNGGGRSSRRGGSSERNRSTAAGEDQRAAASASTEDAGSTRTKGAPMTTIDIALPEHTERTKAFVEGLVAAFGFEGTVESEILDDDNAEVRVTGEELGLLIGPKGQTLAAIQTLARAAVQSQREAHFEGRVHLDISGYRQRRKAALEQFALKLAREVAESGVEKGLEPMGSADRKIVHDTVSTVEGVRTISVGEDPRRRVVIAPAES